MKSEIALAFEHAGWPALLVDGAALICAANPAARKIFGAPVEVPSARLSAIWAPDNSRTAEQTLALWGQAPPSSVSIRLAGKDGIAAAYIVSVCSFAKDNQNYFILQVLPEPAGAGKDPAGFADVALKQKLDCALQLARTVALDFNNALTSILGHTSLLLEQMSRAHPWRHSLDGGGEIGGQGGGNRQRTGHLQPAGKGDARAGRRAT